VCSAVTVSIFPPVRFISLGEFVCLLILIPARFPWEVARRSRAVSADVRSCGLVRWSAVTLLRGSLMRHPV